jgi:signal transduction histidine kinase/HPt (histidine-containing phosphotransfer) domain-containing protein/ActR/RegA family two-component response regulator
VKWLPRTLERQILLLTGFCLGISLLLDGGFAVLRQTREASKTSRSQMEAMAQNIATFSSHFLATRDLDSLEAIANQTSTAGGIESLVVTDVEGKPLLELVNGPKGWSPKFETKNLKVPTLGDVDGEIEQKDQWTSVWRPVQAGGIHMGWVRLNYSTSRFSDAIMPALSEALLLILFATAFTLVLLRRLLQKPMRSLAKATHFAEGLDELMGERIMIESDTLEVEDLCRALNRVSEKLLEQNRSLMKATREAQAASTSKSQFLANMSHEIRTPMNAILGLLQLLGRTELTKQQADYTAKSEGAAKALLGLLNEILDFSKIEAGKMTLDPHPFSLDRLLRDLMVILSAGVGEKPLQIKFDVDPDVPRQLLGDSMRLQQILINLGGNAVKFTAKGEVILGIKTIRHAGGAVTLLWSIQDTGIGIAKENQKRIFSGFTQAEASTTRTFGGTGLGVAISQRLVRLMGGELELQSAPGEGSRFHFTLTLPFVEESPEMAQSDDSGEAMKSAPDGVLVKNLQGMLLLVVEDNRTNQQVAQELLELEGAHVQLANDGVEAVSMLKENPEAFDVVLMDLQMPVMDGLEATRIIRQELKLNALPIVAMTANAMASDRKDCLDAGMDDHVSKPFDLQILIRVVRKSAGWTDASVGPRVRGVAVNGVIQDAAQAAGVDLKAALNRLGGEHDIYTNMLCMFVSELHAMPAQLDDLANQGSADEGKRVLHTLKGLAATLGVDELSNQAAQAEKAMSSAHDQPELQKTIARQAGMAITKNLAPLEAFLLALQGGHQNQSAHKPADAMQKDLQRLAELLTEGNMESMNVMAEIDDAHAGDFGDLLQPLQMAMADMNFELALVHCKSILK